MSNFPILLLSYFEEFPTLSHSPWDYCLKCLEEELSNKQFNTWIRPLQVEEKDHSLSILAPNKFVKDKIESEYLEKIHIFLLKKEAFSHYSLSIDIGCQQNAIQAKENTSNNKKLPITKSNLNPLFTFDSFVGGKSNQLAKAASMQVAENPGISYNPLFIYGGVGLGKTHLMQAAGQAILQKGKDKKIIYLHSERFVSDMVKALQHNTINTFKNYYRSANALLIDDIQFFANKERSQEEFFHTFNTLLEGKHQIILTCDRYPKEVSGLEDRLKSRFGWGLTIAIEPPELETRVAIIKKKAEIIQKHIPDEICFFIAKHFSSNVRELEGALNRIVASSNLTNKPITMELTRYSLRDLLLLQDKLITIENIKKTVADYYKIRISDLLSNRRYRSLARARQMAMTLSKDITNHSLPEIGQAFGGKDHTTVLYACRKIKDLKEIDTKIADDYRNLHAILIN